MIKLATMSSVCPDWTVDETIAAMKKYGYAGYEPRVEWGHKAGVELGLDAAGRKAVRDKFADAGLTICSVATGVKFAMDDAGERARQAETLKKYIDFAADLGCPHVRTFGGAAPDVEPARIVGYMADAIRPVMVQAQARGVTVLLETHDDWCNSVWVRALIDAVNHPNYQALWDIMHTQRFFETPAESFAILAPHIRHMHVHDGKVMGTPPRLEITALGEGAIDHAGPFKLLQNAGFDGFASLEIIHKVGDGGKAEGVLKQYADGLKKLL
ncbi:MAG: sugar phosphate isomerase/epimerase [Planctomycetota bacterium]|nr:sugar phosphate isomerase/epimerase [Planctomycetota bacterium]